MEIIIYLLQSEVSSVEYLNLLFGRLRPGFQPVKVKDSSRPAFVLKADGGEAIIAVNQPSDCLSLQRENVMCGEVDSIDVWFGFHGPAQPESPEVWQEALQHLLNTYKPRYCYIRTRGAETGLGEDVRVEVQGHGCYRGFWNNIQHVLSLIR